MTLSKIRLLLVVLATLIVGVMIGLLLAPKYATAAGGASAEAMVALAGQLLAKNDVQQAESLAFDAIAADPESYLPYVLLGDIFTRRGEIASAHSAYSRALVKLDGPGGNFRVLKLDDQLRQGEQRVLRDKLDRLPKT